MIGCETSPAPGGLRLAISVAALVAIALSPGMLRGQTAGGEGPAERLGPDASSGEELFRRGRAALAAERYPEALALFERSQRLDPAGGTLLNLAVCEERLGRLVRARARLAEALELLRAGDRRRPAAVERLAELDRRMPHVSIDADGLGRAGVTLKLDGDRFDVDAAGGEIAVDPGAHLLSCEGPEGERCGHAFRIAERERLVLVPELSPPPLSPEARPGLDLKALAQPAAAEAPAMPAVSRGRRVLAYTLAGLGAAGIATGLLAGAGVLREKQRMSGHCDARGCDPDGIEAASRGKLFSTVATVATAAGLVSLAGSVYVFVTMAPPGAEARMVAVGGSF